MVFALIEGHKGLSSPEGDPEVFGPNTGFEDRLLEAKELVDELAAEHTLLIATIKSKLRVLTNPAA